MMKKLIAIVLCFAMIFSLAACAANSTEETVPETAAQTASTQPTQADTDTAAEKKILIVYFSSANTNSADLVSEATPMYDGVSATEAIANDIHNEVGGDVAKLTPVNDYPEEYNPTTDAAKAEKDKNERPEFLPLEVNPEDYDVVFVGYPMWWYTLPMIFYTFFDTYDLSGKTIIPFNTHAGSGDGGTYDEIKDFEPNATVLDGIAIAGTDADKAQSEVSEWLTGLNY